MVVKIKSFISQYKEILRYLIVGGLTTVISIATYYICTRYIHIEEMLANMIAWIVSVAFAFVANKLFVFENKSRELSTTLKEAFSFVSGRLFSLLIDTIIMYAGIRLLHINDMVVQLIKQIVVVILNYILAKLVFKKK